MSVTPPPTITTTIRWKKQELNDVKKAATHAGLPVSLFVKTHALNKARDEQAHYSPRLVKELLKAKKEADDNVDIVSFNSPQDFLDDLKSHMKK